MLTTLVEAISYAGPISYIDYSNNRLIISFSYGAIHAYESPELDKWIYLSGISKITPQEILKWYEEIIISGSIDGELSIISFSPENNFLEIQSTQKLHVDAVKDIVIKQDLIYTAGADNYINVLKISNNANLLSLVRLNKILAHNGWVNGLALCNGYLLSQGSDNVFTIWIANDMKRVAEVRFLNTRESGSSVSKPSGGNKWFILAGTQSQIDGEYCVTTINAITFQIIEIPLKLSQRYQTEQLKRKRYEERNLSVNCSAFVKDGFIIAASNFILFYSLPQFTLENEYEFEEDQEVNVTYT